MKRTTLVLLAMLAMSYVAYCVMIPLSKVQHKYKAPRSHSNVHRHGRSRHHNRNIGFFDASEAKNLEKVQVQQTNTVSGVTFIEYNDEKYVTDVWLGGVTKTDGRRISVAVDSTSGATVFFNQECTECTSALIDGENPGLQDFYQCQGQCTWNLGKGVSQPNNNTVPSQGFVFGGRAWLPYYSALDNLRVTDEILTNTHVGMASNLVDPANEFNDTEGVLGLSWHAGTSNLNQVTLLNKLSHSRHGTDKQIFSLYISDPVDTLVLGDKNDFFAQGTYTTYNNIGVITWALEVDSISLNDISVNMQGITPLAHFDTTTRYIWIPTAVLTMLSNTIQTKFSQNLQNGYLDADFTCPKVWSDWPSLVITFGSQAQTFTLEPQDWIEYSNQTSNLCRSLIRDITDFRLRNFNIGSTNSSQTPTILLPQLINNNIQFDWYLGTTFLKKYYTYFDADNNKIGIANAYPIPVVPYHLPSIFRILAIIFGLILFVASLVVLLIILKGVGKVSAVGQARPYVLTEVREFVGTPIQTVPTQSRMLSNQPQYQQQIPTGTGYIYQSNVMPTGTLTGNLQLSQAQSYPLGGEYRSQFK